MPLELRRVSPAPAYVNPLAELPRVEWPPPSLIDRFEPPAQAALREPLMLIASHIEGIRQNKSSDTHLLKIQLKNLLKASHENSMILEENDFKKLRSHFSIFERRVINCIQELRQETLQKTLEARMPDDLKNCFILKGEILDKKIMRTAREGNLDFALWLSPYASDNYGLLRYFIENHHLDAVKQLVERKIPLFRVQRSLKTGAEIIYSPVELLPEGEFKKKATTIFDNQLQEFLLKRLETCHESDLDNIVNISFKLLERNTHFTLLESRLAAKNYDPRLFSQLAEVWLRQKKGLRHVLRARYYLTGSFEQLSQRATALACWFESFPNAPRNCLEDTAYEFRKLALLAKGHFKEPADPDTGQINPESLKKTHLILKDKQSIHELGSSYYFNIYARLVYSQLSVDYKTATALVIQREREILAFEDGLRNNLVEPVQKLSYLVTAKHLESAIKHHAHDVISYLIESGVDYSAHLSEPLNPSVRIGIQKRLEKHPEEAIFFFTSIDTKQLVSHTHKPLEPIPLTNRTDLCKNILKHFDKLIGSKEEFDFHDERPMPFKGKELRNFLKQALSNVETEAPNLLGLPKTKEERQAFYQKLHLILQHVLVNLENPKVPTGNKRTALTRLAQGGMYCATRQFHESRTAVQIFKNEDCQDAYLNSGQKELNAVLESLRKTILLEIQDLYLLHNVHNYGALLASIGHDIGVAEVDHGYIDPLGNRLPDKHELLQAFHMRYQPLRIAKAVSNQLSQSCISDLLAACKPIQEEEKFYDLVCNEDGTFKAESIPTILVLLGILKLDSLPPEELEQSPPELVSTLRYFQAIEL